MLMNTGHRLPLPKTGITAICLLLCCGSFAQADKARYFDSLQGTTWLASEPVNASSIFGKYEMGLQFWGLPLDSLKNTRSVWRFTDSLRILQHNPLTHKDSIVLCCSYIHNKPYRELTLILPSGRMLAYRYLSISTGSYITLTRKNGKRRSR